MIKQTSNFKRTNDIEKFAAICLEYSMIENEVIVPYIGYFENTDDSIYAIVTEYMPNLSLEVMFNNDSPFEWWDFTRKIIFLYGIAYGMAYLHKNSIIHGNLNFSNILISGKGEPKICDLMMSSLFPINIGKLPYNKLIFIPPEKISENSCSKQSDVYSFGICAIMILMDSMSILNEDISGDDLIKQINSGLLRSLPKYIPECIHELLLSLISTDPDKRPSFSQFLEDLESFFPNFEKDELFDLQIFTDYKNKITSVVEQMDEECKQAKRDADKGDPEAMFRYANFRNKGEHCVKNETEAIRYYRKSAECGFEKAINFIKASKRKNEASIPDESAAAAARANINISKLNRLKERLRNQRNSLKVVPEEKHLISTKSVILNLEEIGSFKEFSRLANDNSFNEDPVDITKITNEIEDQIENGRDRLPTEADRTNIEKSNFIITDQSEARLYKILNYIKYRVPVLLEGPTGTSKTLSAEIACQILNDLKNEDKKTYGFVVDGKSEDKAKIELIRFNLSSETKTKDLIGRYVGNPDSWAGISQENGKFYQAFKEGKILLLDEINLASPSVLQCIEEALDSGILSIEIPGKPLIPIKMHENFRLIATQNPNKGLFAHKRQDLGLKFYSRFQVINFPAFTTEELGKIAEGLAKQFNYKNKKVISQLVKFHETWINRPEIQDDTQCFTIREMAATVRALSNGENVNDTIMTIYGARYQERIRKILIDVLKSYPELNGKGKKFTIPSDFLHCYQNESLIRAVKSALFSLKNGRHVIITGKEGCGKTQVALWISQHFNKFIRKDILMNSENFKKILLNDDDEDDKSDGNFYCICTEDTKVADLVGHQSPSDKADAGKEIIAWIPGFLTQAIEKGKCSVLESIDEAPATVTERLNGLLDQKYDGKERYFDIPENPNPKENHIVITESFRILATCDIDKISFVSPAFLNRFDVIVLEDQINIDSSSDDYDELSEILLNKFFEDIYNNKKSTKKRVAREDEVKMVSSIFKEHPETWNNLLKISKGCKAVSTFLNEFKVTEADKIRSTIDFAINLLSGDKNYHLPKEIENKLLDKLEEEKRTKIIEKEETKSTDPEFYFKNSALLCEFMAKLMAFSLIQQPVCVSGPTGAGKTSAARKFARMRSRHTKSDSQFQMHSFHAGTKTSQFYGTKTLANGKITSIEGTLTKALSNGDVFIADEFNLSPQSVMKSLAPALEQTVGSSIFIPGIDKSINISSEFFFIACQNELGTLGRNAIPETISPRFAYIDYPKPELEDLQTICREIAKENDENDTKSCISEEIATKIAGFMQDINSLSSPYITPWSLRDISKIFKRIRYQQKNSINYIDIDNYHHIYFYTLSSVPHNNIENAIKQIKDAFKKFNPDDGDNFVSKYEKDYKEPPIIDEKQPYGYYIMKGDIGVRVEPILVKMMKKSILLDGKIHEDPNSAHFSDLINEFNDFEFSKLASLWNTTFQVCLSDDSEPLLLMGNSGFKTFLSQQIIEDASIIPLNQETTVSQLLGSSGFFTSSEAKHFYINNLCKICYESPTAKLIELQKKWEEGSLTKKDINRVVKDGFKNEKNPESFKYMINHLSESIFNYNDDDKCVLSNTTLEFRPGLFLNAILQKKSLILKDLSNLPTIVLERFNELFSGKQNITLTEDIHHTFTSPTQKELTDFNKSFRVIGTCPANTPSKLSEAVLSRFTVIATPEYNNNERKIVLTSVCKINKLDFQIEDIQLILDVAQKIKDNNLRPYTFSLMIKTVQLTSRINKLNPTKKRFNLAIAMFRLLSGLENKDKKKIFDIIKEKICPEFPELFINNERETKPLFITEEGSNNGIKSHFTDLFIHEPAAHEYEPAGKKVALTSHLCDILDAIHLSIAVYNPIILEGPPGQGKHTAIEYIANMLNTNVIYITISQSTKVDDLLGKQKIERGEDGVLHIQFTKSKLTEKISSSSSKTDKPIIVIENINNATPAVLNALLSIFDVETKNILLPSGETLEKGEFYLIGIFNTQQSTNTRDKLPPSLINSTIYYVVNNPSDDDITKIVQEKFPDDSKEYILFYNQFMTARKFLHDNHLPEVFTLNDISKYLLFRKETKKVFPNPETIMQMIFVYRFFQDTLIEKIRKELGYDIITFMPSFNYDNSKSFLLIQATDDHNVLSIPLIKSESSDSISFNPEETISKINTLTPTQKYCLIFMSCALLSHRACVIQGGTSSGKSFMIRLFAELIGAKLNVFQMNADSSVAMLAGQSVLNEKPSPEDISKFQDYLDSILKIDSLPEIDSILKTNSYTKIEDTIKTKKISRDNISDCTPKILSEMLSEASKIVSSYKEEVVIDNDDDEEVKILIEEIEKAIKNFRELMNPVHRFDNKESELIRAMREGEWVLIDGIESAPPEIAEKIASLCGENPELNLFECGPEFIFSKENGKIHKDFQLFITYNPFVSKVNQPIDQSFLIKSVSFTLPEIDSSEASSAQILFGSMLNQHYPRQIPKEIASRLGFVHNSAKLTSISRDDSFAGDIQFTGRTLKFITEVFKHHINHEPKLSISKPIAFSIKAFYLNSLIDLRYMPEFKNNLKCAFSRIPTDLIKTLEQNQKNIRQRNHFVLLTLRNIQLHILRDEKLNYDFRQFIVDINSIQTSDVSFIEKHIDDTISIMTKENPKNVIESILKLGSLIIIKNLLKGISDTLRKSFKVEHSCLKLNEKDLKSEKDLEKPLSQLHLITELSNDYINPNSSLLLCSNLYQDILFFVGSVAKSHLNVSKDSVENTRAYLKGLIQIAIDRPESIDFIDAIFPGHLFVNTGKENVNADLNNVNFVLPVIFKSIIKNVSFKIHFSKDDIIEYESDKNADFSFNLFLTDTNSFNVDKESYCYAYSRGSKKRFQFKSKKNDDDEEKINFMFYKIINLILDNEKQPIKLDSKKASEYKKTASSQYETEKELKYEKIIRLSNFFEKTDKPLNMICYAWNLVSTLNAEAISAILQIVNPFESYVLDIIYRSLNECTYETYNDIIEFTRWAYKFDRELEILLKAVSKIEIQNASDEEKIALFDKIDYEKSFLLSPPKTIRFLTWKPDKFIKDLEIAQDLIYGSSDTVKTLKKNKSKMDKLKNELQNSKDFPENDEIRLSLIAQIDALDKTPENYKMMKKKVRHLLESIKSNSMKDGDNKIIWPTLFFESEKIGEKKELQKLQALLDYSRVVSIINKIMKEKNKLKYLPNLSSYKSKIVSLPSLFDHYIKHEENPKDLIETIFHELKANFLYDLYLIDSKEAKQINEYVSFYRYYEITKVFNNRIDRNNPESEVSEDELKKIQIYASKIPENLEFILPDIIPEDLIYFLIVKTGNKNNKSSSSKTTIKFADDDIKPGPFFNGISIQTADLIRFSDLLDKKFSSSLHKKKNFLDTVADIARAAYEVFLDGSGIDCPETPSKIHKNIIDLMKSMPDQTAVKYKVFRILRLMFEFASKEVEIEKKKKTEYFFRFDDLQFFEGFSNLSEWATKYIESSPSFVFWGLKNSQLLDQIIHTYKDKIEEIEGNPKKLPFWLHCLRVFSSIKCIQFIPRSYKYKMTPVKYNVNQSISKQIAFQFNDLAIFGTNWLNLVLPNVPTDLYNEPIHMIYLFLKNICDDQALKNENIIDKLCKTVEIIVTSIFENDIDNYFDKELPKTNDKSLISFFMDPANYLIKLIRDNFIDKCNDFLKYESVQDLMKYMFNTRTDNYNNYKKIQIAIDEDIKRYKIYKENRFQADQISNLSKELDDLIKEYDITKKKLKKKSNAELEKIKNRLSEFHVEFDRSGNIKDQERLKLVTDYIKEHDIKFEIKNIIMIIKSFGSNYPPQYILDYLNEISKRYDEFEKCFCKYIQIGQVGMAEQYLTDFTFYINVIVNAESSFINDEEVKTVITTLQEIRPHYNELLNRINAVKDDLSKIPKFDDRKGSNLDSEKVFRNSFEIILPNKDMQTRKIKKSETEYFRIKRKIDSFELPAISLTKDGLKCSVNMIKCIIKPFIPSLYSDNVTISIISLVDRTIDVEINPEVMDNVHLTYTKNVGPRNPIQISAKIPLIRSDECRICDFQGEITFKTGRSKLKMPLRIVFQLIPMKVKLYCEHYNLSNTVTAFRVCCEKFFSGDSAKIFIYNLYNLDSKTINYTYETEPDNEVECPIFDIKQTKTLPKQYYIDVLMQSPSPKKMHFTLKVAMSQKLIANILFNCLIVPFKFFLEVYDYRTKKFVSNSAEIFWTPNNVIQKLYFRIMCPCIPKKVFTKVFFDLPNGMIIHKVTGLDNYKHIPTKSGLETKCTYEQEFTSNFIFIVEFRCEGKNPPSTLKNENKSKYSISSIFVTDYEDLKNLNTQKDNRIDLYFMKIPPVKYNESTSTLKFETIQPLDNVPIHIYNYETQVFIPYKKSMKINDFSGTDKPLIYVTPFSSDVISAKNQTKITYEDKKVVVDCRDIDTTVNYLKLGTDGSLMKDASTPDPEILNNKLKKSNSKFIAPQKVRAKIIKFFDDLAKGAAISTTSQQKPSIKYTIIGQLNSKTSIWFPTFQIYPRNPIKLDVIPENIEPAKKYIDKEIRNLFKIRKSEEPEIDYKNLLDQISNNTIYDSTNFGIFMLIMLDKSNLKKVSELIDAMPEDFKSRCTGITRYIPPDTAFKEEEEDLLIIYSYNIIFEFSRIFEERYNEIKSNKNSLVSSIPQEKIDDAQTKVFYEFFNFDSDKKEHISNVESPNYKAHEEYRQYLDTTSILPLRSDSLQCQCYDLSETSDPVPSTIINKDLNLEFNIPEIDEPENNDNGYIGRIPDIKIPQPFTINSLNSFYSSCAQAAKIIPAILINNNDEFQAANLFVKLFEIYKQFKNNEYYFPIISEAVTSFINSFDSTVCWLKNEKVNFNFLNEEEIKIINSIKVTNSSDWILMPQPDSVSLPPKTWKTKTQNARDPVKDAAIRVEVQNNLNLQNDFHTTNSVFSFDPAMIKDDEEEKTKETEHEEVIIDDDDLTLKTFAADDSDEDSNDDEMSEDDGKETNKDGTLKVIRNIGKLDKKNINQGKAADSILSKLKETDGIERVISRIRSMDKEKLFTFKNIQKDSLIIDSTYLETDKTDFPITKFISNASYLIGYLILSASDDKSVRATGSSYPYQFISANLLIDCSSYIPETNKIFNVLLLVAFAYALDYLKIRYEIAVVADTKFRFILKSFDEPHSPKALQRALDCVLIKRYRTNYPDTFHHATEYMKDEDEQRTQRAVFLFTDGLDENLVLTKAWNLQILNKPSISFGILATVTKSLVKENKTEMENTWKNFAEETKFPNSVSIARIAYYDSNLNSFPNVQKIASCFKDVLSRQLTVQDDFEPIRNEIKPIFDFDISELSPATEYKIYNTDIDLKPSIFVSNEKVLPTSSSNKIHIEKLNISLYRGKTSKICSCNVDKSIHDSFTSFMHRMSSKLKNIFRSQLETIFKPNKASQTVLSNTGTDFDITALVLNLINPVPDPFIYLEEKGGLIRNYGVSVVIDTSNSCFNFIVNMHSVKTVINILCALSSIEIPCVDVILATQEDPIVLCSELPSMHALGEKSSIWPAIFSYLLQHQHKECNLEDAIHCAYDLRRMRGIDYSSMLFVLTDGLYMAKRKEKIKEEVLKSIQLGINVIGIGIGLYPVGIPDIFPQSVFASNPNDVIRAISVCFGDDNPQPVDKMYPLLTNPPLNTELNELFNKYNEFDQNPIFIELKNKLKQIPAAIDAFSDVYNEEQEYKGKSYKDVTKNPEGKNTEMYIANVLKGQKILIAMLYSADYNLAENPHVDKKYLFKNPEFPEKDDCVNKAVSFFGIDIVVVENYDDAIKELLKREDDKCIYYATWVISGWKYKDNPYNYDPNHVVAFTECLIQYWKSGGAVVLFAEGEPLTFQANYFLEQLTFPDGSKTQLRLHGNHEGTKFLFGDKEGKLESNATFNKSPLEFKKCERASLSHNLFIIYEGETISFADDNPEIYKPFIRFSKDSEGGISALYYPFDPESGTGDIIIDCGYTKLFDKMTEDGTSKYVQNIAGWTGHVEYSLTNNIKPERYRPKGFEFDLKKYLNIPYTQFEKSEEIYKANDGFDVDVDKLQTIFAIDYSGSTCHDDYYHSHIKDIFDKYKEGDLIIIWSTKAEFIDYDRMKNIWTNKQGSGLTYPQEIIKLILNCDPPITAEHLVLATDGYIDEEDVDECNSLVEKNDVHFKMVDTYIIGETGDLSVGNTFQKKSPSTTYHYKPSQKEPDIEYVSKKDIRIFNMMDAIDTLAKFEENFNSLFKVIKNKMMGTSGDKDLEAKLREMDRKIRASAKEITFDYDRKINALINMSTGAIKGIFNNNKITAMYK